MTDLPEYGPAFSQLSEMQKKFVLAMAADPLADHNEWAIAAGYSDVNGCARIKACQLLQDSRIEAAAFEVARGTMGAVGPLLATSVLLRVCADPKHPQQVKAAELIANRVGFHETQEIKVTHRDLTGDALMARLAQVCERLGVDAQKLIGSNVIEGKAVEVKPDEVRS